MVPAAFFIQSFVHPRRALASVDLPLGEVNDVERCGRRVR